MTDYVKSSSREKTELVIPADRKVADPISYAVSEQSSVKISSEPGSSATIFLHIKSPKVDINVSVGEESSLNIVCLQDAGAKAFTSQKAQVSAGGRVHWHNVTLGSDVTQDLRSELVGINAESTVDWVFRARDKEKQKLSARNVFSANNGAGEITLKGVAEATGKVTCYGMIEIAEQGKGTVTYLTEDVLMLDKTAHVDAVPGLEIRTNDVKASHSATVSRVTDEDLFYFQSRGITKSVSRAMYIEGFIGDLIGRIADVAVRQIVLDAVA